jgi:hypothetical protein
MSPHIKERRFRWLLYTAVLVTLRSVSIASADYKTVELNEMLGFVSLVVAAIFFYELWKAADEN